MIFKRFVLGDFDGELPAHLLKVGSKGVDSEQFQKLSSAVVMPEIKPEPGHAFIHLITVGAGEHYGANNNADYFPEGDSEWAFPLNNKTASLKGGLKKYHRTYKDYGGVYHHHRNSRKGFEKQGEVVWECYREPMHRGEVIIRVSEDLRDGDGKPVWEDTLQKLARDELVPFSQGSSVPFDTCSLCGNRAETAKDHCQHIRQDKLAFHKSGRQIFMINHEAYFHDISRVAKPAERIALSLRKVASDGPSYAECSPEGMVIPVRLVEKLGSRDQQDRFELLCKLSRLEKEVPMMAREVVGPLSGAHCLEPSDEERVTDLLEGIPEDVLINSLKSADCMLTPRTFSIILLKKKPEDVPGFDSVEGLLRDVFTEILEHGNPNEFLSDGSYKPQPCSWFPGADEKVCELSGLLSLSPDKVEDRVLRVSLKPSVRIEKRAAEPTAEAGVIAKEYAKYQLSLLASGKSDGMRERYVVSVNQNF